MADQNLVSFIEASLKQGSSKEDIEAALLSKGWQKSAIDEGFSSDIEKTRVTIINNSKFNLIKQPLLRVSVFVICALVFLGYKYFLLLNGKDSNISSNSEVLLAYFFLIFTIVTQSLFFKFKRTIFYQVLIGTSVFLIIIQTLLPTGLFAFIILLPFLIFLSFYPMLFYSIYELKHPLVEPINWKFFSKIIFVYIGAILFALLIYILPNFLSWRPILSSYFLLFGPYTLLMSFILSLFSYLNIRKQSIKFYKFFIISTALLILYPLTSFLIESKAFDFNKNSNRLKQVTQQECVFDSKANNFSFNIDCSWDYNKKTCENAWGCMIFPGSTLSSGEGMELEVNNKESATSFIDGNIFADVGDNVQFSFQDNKFQHYFDTEEIIPWRTNSNNIIFYKFRDTNFKIDKYCTVKDDHFICFKVSLGSKITEQDIIKIIDSFKFYNESNLAGDWSVFVYDLNTNEPISNAQVEVGYYRDLWNGCNYHNTYETNEEGYVSADDLKAKYICDIVVKKDGYINNGTDDEHLNHSMYPANKKIYLKKIHTDQRQYTTSQIYEGDVVDILSYINTPIPYEVEGRTYYKSIEPSPGTIASSNNYIPDLLLQSKNNKIKIVAQGEGGIQEITNKTDYGASYEEPFKYVNLTVSPKDGYQKEIDITNNEVNTYRRYIVKLRDGKTYVKLVSQMSRDQNNKVSVVFSNIMSFNPVNENIKLDEQNTKNRELIVYPQDKLIRSITDIYLEGRGFKPKEEIQITMENTDIKGTAIADENGEWYSSFGDHGYNSTIISKSMGTDIRTIDLISSNYNQKISFTISSSRQGKMYFTGLTLSFPDNLRVWRQYYDGSETVEMTDTITDSNRYIISSTKESYISYINNLRQKKSLENTSIPGVVKYFSDSSGTTEYSFYDSRVKRSYKFFESIYEGKTRLNWDIEYPLSFIEDEQIQQ